jgi:hypothetical protein
LSGTWLSKSRDNLQPRRRTCCGIGGSGILGSVLGALSITAGVLLLLATALAAVRTLVVPRGLTHRVSWNFDAFLHAAFRGTARLLPSYRAKDRVLSYEGPLRLMGYLFVWLGSALIGYALIFWPFSGSFAGGLADAGSAMFTLGFVPVSKPVPIAASFVAAVTGLVLIALQIAYLPTLYAAFNRRETLVTMLSSRTGQPPWGPEVLARHTLIGNLNDMPQFFRDWEMWAADVAESHTNYPVLLAFRAPHPLRSWVVALNAVLDAAAMYLALSPRHAPSQANACLRMGYVALREIAGVMAIDFNSDPLPDDPIELTFDDFRAGVAVVDEVGFPRQRSLEEAWIHFRGWRVNYEPLTYEIGDRLIAPPGLWAGERRQLPGIVIPPERPAHRQPAEMQAQTPTAIAR